MDNIELGLWVGGAVFSFLALAYSLIIAGDILSGIIATLLIVVGIELWKLNRTVREYLVGPD